MKDFIIPPEIAAVRTILNAWKDELDRDFTMEKYLALLHLEAEFLKLMTKLRIQIDARTDELERDFTMEKYLALDEIEIEFHRLMGRN